MIECDEYRLAMVIHKPRQIFATFKSGASHLPTVRIPKWTRPAEEITSAIYERWQIESVVIDFLTETLSVPCAIVEVRAIDPAFPEHGLERVDLDMIAPNTFSDDERAAFNSIVADECDTRGPFSRFGWVDEAQKWIKSIVSDHEVEFTNDIRQLSASGTSALVRFATKRGPAYWMKAVGKPDIHEFTVTTNLAKLCPEFLPRVLSARSDWNAWIMEETATPRDRPFNLTDLAQVVTRLAELQKRLAGKIEELFALGCMDQRVEFLQSRAIEVTDFLAYAMDQQTTTKAPRLGRARVQELGCIVQEACGRMRQLAIPNSLIHNDLHPANILFDGDRCVFTDWCEVFVGNPFVTLEHLCVRPSPDPEESDSWSKYLRRLYKDAWLNLLTADQIDRAFVLTPLLAIFGFLYGRGTWLTTPLRHNARFLGRARSLTRLMDRAAHNPQLIELLCH